jgi:hypothetical protein
MFTGFYLLGLSSFVRLPRSSILHFAPSYLPFVFLSVDLHNLFSGSIDASNSGLRVTPLVGPTVFIPGSYTMVTDPAVVIFVITYMQRSMVSEQTRDMQRSKFVTTS